MSSRGVLRLPAGRRAAIVGTLVVAAMVGMWLFLALLAGTVEQNRP